MMNLIRIRFLFAAALLATLLAACGGGSGSSLPGYGSSDSASTASSAQSTNGAGSSASSTTSGVGGYDYGASGSAPGASGQAGNVSSSPVASATPTTSNPDAQRFTIVPDKSEATYHAHQKSFVPGIGAGIDGKTSDISGTVFFDPKNPSRSEIAPITVNLKSLDSGIDLRDQRLHNEFLESNKFPTATFKTTRLQGLPTTPYTDGDDLDFKIVGNLTLHGVTREVTFDASGKVTGGTLTATAKTNTMLTDFGMTVPDLLNFIKAENKVGIELSFTAQQA
jgi:polyisoprenoid-binding protein YceI